MKYKAILKKPIGELTELTCDRFVFTHECMRAVHLFLDEKCIAVIPLHNLSIIYAI